MDEAEAFARIVAGATMKEHERRTAHKKRWEGASYKPNPESNQKVKPVRDTREAHSFSVLVVTVWKPLRRCKFFGKRPENLIYNLVHTGWVKQKFWHPH